ncbi:MAG TPA: aminopeptidase [Succinivibrionaceae bacterium]|nr:aminopeptidase [Succinivibrionaceae bacterium]
MSIEQDLFDFCKDIFPICRSITGPGVRSTLQKIKYILPNLEIHSVKSGTKVFDWTVPKEWIIRDAYIEHESGTRFAEFKKCNLHVLGYSAPANRFLSLDELKRYIYTIPGNPDAIPYVTSYYKERYGFCMSENDKNALPEGRYHIVIDSELTDGCLNYAELFIKGKSQKEILLSTYICHPSMANDNTSGISLATYLGKWLSCKKDLRYSYRVIFIPETIGSITYLSLNLAALKKNLIAGFVLSCVGDNRAFSITHSRYGNTLADKAAFAVLKNKPNFQNYNFLHRGSDERQFSAPGVDLPVCTISRSKYGGYPEYHTSKDDMSVISPEGLKGSFDALTECIDALEHNHYYQTTCLCEPQLGRRGLYATLSTQSSYTDERVISNVIAYSDGNNDLFDLCRIQNCHPKELIHYINILLEQGILTF